MVLRVLSGVNASQSVRARSVSDKASRGRGLPVLAAAHCAKVRIVPGARFSIAINLGADSCDRLSESLWIAHVSLKALLCKEGERRFSLEEPEEMIARTICLIKPGSAVSSS